jgi:acyl-coenzyme A synthetase/AMP-(fatty) acid ligase/thioesterase domain-containing protein
VPAHSPTSAPEKLRTLAQEDPDRPAIVARDGTLTYAALDAAVDRMAAWLLAGREPGDERIVVLRFRSTPSLIISSLALARAGLVSAMIDPMAPPARVRTLLDDLAVDGRWVLVTDAADDVRDFAHAIMFDDAQSEDLVGLTAARELGLDDLQSIIYTSGSTGAPVGLQVTGRQRIAMDTWARQFDVYRDGARIGILGAGTLGRASEAPRFVLMAGATMVVHDVLADGLDTIPAWLRDHHIEAIPLVPTLLLFLLPALRDELGLGGVLDDLRAVVVWGEPSDWETIVALAQHLPPDAVVLNAYGQTETGLVASFVVSQDLVRAARDRSGPLPAGTPVAQVSVRLVDPAGTDVVAGDVGELLVSSPHLARGHWRRPELTRDALVEHDGTTYWRTGDGGYVNADGLLHVTGRLDDVVKIHGHRISLLEVERAAREQPGVRSAAAVAREDPDSGLRLHLFVVAEEEKVHPRWLRSQMARVLPPAALPDTVDLVDVLPTLPNGKLDRTELPQHRTGDPAPDVADPDLVSRVAGLFGEVLRLSGFAADDEFFEHGGDSLRAGRLVGLLQTRLGLVVPASLVLEAPTPRMLAIAVRSSTSLVVPIRTEGTGTPFFVIHGGAGDVWFAHSLARHLDAAPVYAVQPPPLVDPTPFAPSLHAVADRYLEEILRVRPTGPYRLFGYSMGGVIALEIALRLQARGETVEQLALGDSLPPDLLREVRLEDREHQRQARHEARRRAVARVDVRFLVRLVGHHLSWRASQRRQRAWWREFEAGHPPAPEIRSAAYQHVYGRLLVDHRITGVFVGDVTLVAAGQERGPDDNGWSRHVDGSVRVTTLDTDHSGLVHEPHLADLCGALVAGSLDPSAVAQGRPSAR